MIVRVPRCQQPAHPRRACAPGLKIMRILYVQPGLVPPPTDARTDKLFRVPLPVTGDILLPIWYRSPDEVRDSLGENAYPEYQMNQFTYHLCLTGNHGYGSAIQKIRIFWFYITRGLSLHRRKNYDCIMSYGWNVAGIAALVLKWLTGAKLIVELGGVPQDAYRFNRFGRTYDAPSDNWITRVMRTVSDALLHIVVGSANRVKLLYPEQLDRYPRLKHIPASVIHAFVPVSMVPFVGESDDSVLLVGAPWYVKGVDLLIRAFRSLESDFPHVRLKLLGYYPDERTLRELIGDSSQIEILAARSHSKTLQLIARTSVFALPSRTEAAGRVALEAMAAGKPVIASRVGGIPQYVKEGVNGLLFETENVHELACKLRLLLSSPDLRKRLGDKGYELAHTRYDEVTFGQEFAKMVELTVSGSPVSSQPQRVGASGRAGTV
jgi:glycosyltransferase involved in cell wall biosynthesis